MSSYIVLPLVGAFIGYITNYVAVKMLFHPKREIRIFFISVQGVFPKRQRAFAEKLGQLVSSELLSIREVTGRISEKASSESVMKAVAEHIERVITEKLPKAIPMLAFALTPELIAVVKNAFLVEMKSLIGDVLGKISGEIEQELDIHRLVADKVANFSADKLEEILFAIMHREFRFIEVVGGVLGALIGVVQAILAEVQLLS